MLLFTQSRNKIRSKSLDHNSEKNNFNFNRFILSHL